MSTVKERLKLTGVNPKQGTFAKKEHPRKGDNMLSQLKAAGLEQPAAHVKTPRGAPKKNQGGVTKNSAETTNKVTKAEKAEKKEKKAEPEIVGNVKSYLQGLQTRPYFATLPSSLLRKIGAAKTKCEAKKILKGHLMAQPTT